MKIRISEIVKLLEAPYTAYVGTNARPGDGRVGLAYKRKPLQRPMGYPYDRNDPDQAYGQPGNMPNRANGGMRPDHHPGGPVPANTAHTVWDMLQGITSKKSGFEEASGTPMNFTMSGRGGMATNIPGGSGMRGWGGAPTHPWDEDDMDDELAAAGKAEGVATFPLEVPVEPIPNQDPEHWADTSDQSLEHLLSRIGKEPDMHPEDDEEFPGHETGDDPADQYSEFPSVLMAVQSEPSFQSGLGRSMVPGRGFQQGWTETYDLQVPEAMVWETIAKLLGIE